MPEPHFQGVAYFALTLDVMDPITIVAILNWLLGAVDDESASTVIMEQQRRELKCRIASVSIARRYGIPCCEWVKQ